MTTMTRRAAFGAIASIPAIGGATAALASQGIPMPAEPLPSRIELLSAYSEWLYFERLLLMRDIHPGLSNRRSLKETAFVPCNTLATNYHFPPWTENGPTWETVPSPATRALLVLQAVGMDFRPLGERP